MLAKHNKQLVPLAKQLRKEMTREERHLWYDFLRDYPVRFLRQKFWVSTSLIFIVQKPDWLLNWMVLSIMMKTIWAMMNNALLF